MSDRIILTADAGRVLTNGREYGTIIYLAEGADPAAYYQIPREEYDAIMAAGEDARTDDATEADYQAALQETTLIADGNRDST